MTNLYVQYGCGWDAPDGWLNFDGSPTLRVEMIPLIGKSISRVMKRNADRFPENVRYGDIIRGLPVKDGSCSGVYCSHVLEHLSLADFRTALENTIKILDRNGIFRLVVPDLERLAIRYVDSRNSADAAFTFLRESGLGEMKRSETFAAKLVECFGNSRHRWMWDYSSIEKELLAIGFSSVRRAQIGDADDAMFAVVEREDRWSNCLGVECRL